MKPLCGVVSSSCKNVPDEPELALLQVLLMSALLSGEDADSTQLSSTETSTRVC